MGESKSLVLTGSHDEQECGIQRVSRKAGDEMDVRDMDRHCTIYFVYFACFGRSLIIAKGVDVHSLL